MVTLIAQNTPNNIKMLTIIDARLFTIQFVNNKISPLHVLLYYKILS